MKNATSGQRLIAIHSFFFIRRAENGSIIQVLADVPVFPFHEHKLIAVDNEFSYEPHSRFVDMMFSVCIYRCYAMHRHSSTPSIHSEI